MNFLMTLKIFMTKSGTNSLGVGVSVIPREKDQLVLKAKGVANVMRSDVAIALSHIAVVFPLSSCNTLMICIIRPLAELKQVVCTQALWCKGRPM